MSRLTRGAYIVWIVLRYGLDELVLTSFQKPWLHWIARVVSVVRRWSGWGRSSSSSARCCRPGAT